MIKSNRLLLVSMLAASLLVGLVVTMAVPFRVADCGPADPMLLRYLGGPLLHSTGTGIPSSLESRIWAGPFLANVALVAVVVFGLQILGIRGHCPPRARVLWIALSVASAAIMVLALLVVNANSVEWTLNGPPITAEVCDIRFEFSPDHRGWQRPEAS